MIRRRGVCMEDLPDPQRAQDLRDAFDAHYESSVTKEAVVGFLRAMSSFMRRSL